MKLSELIEELKEMDFVGSVTFRPKQKEANMTCIGDMDLDLLEALELEKQGYKLELIVINPGCTSKYKVFKP